MLCVLRNAMGFLGELAVRAVPPREQPRYRVVDPLVEFADAVIDDDDVAPAVSADAEHGPAGVRVPPSTPPAGRTAELAALIAEVLSEHVAYDYAGRVECEHRATMGMTLFDCWASWRQHMSWHIADRIKKATPPAPFTFGDLTWAAGVIRAYLALGPIEDARERIKLRELSDRLADAGIADPNP